MFNVDNRRNITRAVVEKSIVESPVILSNAKDLFS